MSNEPEDADQLEHDDYVESSDNDEDQNPDVIPGADDTLLINNDKDDDGA